MPIATHLRRLAALFVVMAIAAQRQVHVEAQFGSDILRLLQIIAERTGDPCLRGTHNCSDKETCHSQYQNPVKLWTAELGKEFLCYGDEQCNHGYNSAISNDGQHYCQDIDECLISTHSCYRYRATCTNTNGSYTCACHVGYVGDGLLICDNVDECQQGTHTCGASAECVDRDGSYSCGCMDGFLGDGHRECTDIDECLYNMHDCGKQPAAAAPLVDNSGSSSNGSRPEPNCHNTIGAFYCSCGAGWTGTDRHCSDVDECAGDGACAGDGVLCTNVPGSYRCTCRDGFEAAATTDGAPLRCTDRDECAGDALDLACDENAACRNVPGSYACACHDGYSGDGFRCTSVSRKCQVTEWQPWTACTFSCRPQRRRRWRRLLAPPPAGHTCALVEEGVCPTLKCDYRYDYETRDYPGVVRDPVLVPVYVYTGFHPGDCEVTRWGPWSQCCQHSTRLDSSSGTAGAATDAVMASRERQVVRYPVTWGRECPPLLELKRCTYTERCPGQP